MKTQAYSLIAFHRMAILSSREHTCIQQSTKNKTELCNELLDPMKVCIFTSIPRSIDLSSQSAEFFLFLETIANVLATLIF